ncbi:MAG: phosphoribosylglycinamide formyltransferase [Flavobacteriaceae bacterium]
MKRIAIFASGSGSNAENIYYYFNGKSVEVTGILTNNKNAKVLERANRLQIESAVFNRIYFLSEDFLKHPILKDIDLIVLAGFLWKVPEYLITAFPNKIINIHPALLPKYGGKGMYGMNVHKAVVENKERETGITIHYVNENYDEGAIIFQATTEVLASDTAEDVVAKIHELEFEHFPKIIEKVLFENE